MKVLVTGGMGYIGSHTVVELLENNSNTTTEGTTSTTQNGTENSGDKTSSGTTNTVTDENTGYLPDKGTK